MKSFSLDKQLFEDTNEWSLISRKKNLHFKNISKFIEIQKWEKKKNSIKIHL